MLPKPARAVFTDSLEAIELLTRVPVSVRFRRGADSAWAWPLVGAFVGVASAATAFVAIMLGLTTQLSAALALLVQVVLTGALHEDGLADTADGFWGGTNARRRLEIMKDSRIGTYGVLALIFGVFLRWLALDTLFQGNWVFAPVIAAAVLSRASMAIVMTALPNARKTGLADSVGRPPLATTGFGAFLAIGIAAVSVGAGAVLATLVALVALTVVILIARSKVAGQTGDILGATQLIVEAAVLITFTTLQ